MSDPESQFSRLTTDLSHANLTATLDLKVVMKKLRLTEEETNRMMVKLEPEVLLQAGLPHEKNDRVATRKKASQVQC